MSKKKGSGNRRRGQRPAQRRTRRGRRKEAEAFQFRPNLREADPALLQDIRRAFPDGRLSDPAMMTEMVITSYDLADEPEFRGLLARPTLSSTLFVGLAEEMGIGPDELPSIEDWAESNLWLQLMSEVTLALLREDEEFLPDVVEALSQMRPRLKQRGRHYAAGQAAMVQLLLETGDEAGWRAAGLLLMLALRSVLTGFTMGDLQERMGETLREVDLEGVDASFGEAQAPELRAIAQELIEGDPTLRAYAERKLDKIWEAGFQALTRRELELDLFSSQEVAGGVERARDHVWVDRESDTLDFEMEPLLDSLRPYVEELMTPQRTAHLRQQLEAYRGQRRHGKWHRFLELVGANLEASSAETLDPRTFNFVLVALLMESLAAYVEILEEEE